MKKILLIGILFFISGCSINYQATITEDKISEEVILYSDEEYNFPSPVFIDIEGVSGEYSAPEDLYVEGVEYYQKTFDGTKSKYNYSFAFNEFSRSRAANMCYKAFKLTNVSDYVYLLNTNSYNSCFDYYSEIEEITINLTLDTNIYQMVSNNADLINNNTYIWTLNKENYHNKHMQLVFEKKKVEGESKEPHNPNNSELETHNKSNNIFSLIIVFVVLLLFIIGIVGLIKYKSINKDE